MIMLPRIVYNYYCIVKFYYSNLTDLIIKYIENLISSYAKNKKKIMETKNSPILEISTILVDRSVQS